jgi:small subunit ribosomal protein S7
VAPDIRFGNENVARFINKVMTRGKKALAERIVYQALDLCEQRAKRDALEIFETALRNATPQLEVRPRRVGGATYQVPMEIRPERRTSLAMRWLIQSARARSGKSMVEKLAAELLDTAGGQSATIRRRDETHRMAEANRAFAHYRW